MQISAKICKDLQQFPESTSEFGSQLGRRRRHGPGHLWCFCSCWGSCLNCCFIFNGSWDTTCVQACAETGRSPSLSRAGWLPSLWPRECRRKCSALWVERWATRCVSTTARHRWEKASQKTPPPPSRPLVNQNQNRVVCVLAPGHSGEVHDGRLSAARDPGWSSSVSVQCCCFGWSPWTQPQHGE